MFTPVNADDEISSMNETKFDNVPILISPRISLIEEDSSKEDSTLNRPHSYM